MENNDCSNNKIRLYSLSGKEFFMKGTELEDSFNITVVKPGYIITPEGAFIHIDQDDCHSEVMSYYLGKYLDEEELQLGITASIAKLNELGHIAYLGLRPNEDSYRSCSVEALIWHPGFENLTKRQHQSVDIILENNIAGCSKRRMFNIMFGNYSQGCENCIPEYEALTYLEESKANIK